MKVNQIDISKDMKVSDLIAQFEASDVLGAGRVARATDILANMIKDEDTNVFMSLGGPLIPGGMRNIVSQMIREGHVDLIVSSGANLTHDLLEAFGGAHYRDEGKDDEELNAEGIEFNEGLDEITPSLDTKISDNLTIQLVKVEVTNEVATEDIDYETIVEEDESLDINTEDVRQAGEAGQKEITYKVIKKNGKEVSREVVQSKVIKEPVNEIIVQGTRRVFASRDGEMEYKDLIYCESTAYAGDTITATGTVPSYNPGGISTIAVDPRVIPLGSLVYVENYGKAIAADTGGLIKGKIIDVFLNSESECRTWGRKYNVPVYILAYPGEW